MHRISKSAYLLVLIASLAFSFIAVSSATAQTLKGFDINPGPGHSSPVVPQFLGDRIVFIADDGTGRELWQSDGTSGGTFKVLDINPSGDAFPLCCRLVYIDGAIYFGADDGVSGQELWISDGTGAGTHMVADLNPGPGYSYPRFFTKFGLDVYFATATSGIYKTDGTAGGTVLASDVRGASDLTPLGSNLYFGGLRFNPGDSGFGELWVSDGTIAGTSVLLDINPAGNASLQDLTVVGPKLFFSAEEPATGRELWVTDGTAAGTHLVKDIGPGATSFGSFTHFFTAFDGLLYFTADDGSGRKLWKSDGSQLGTVPAANLTQASWPAVHDGYLYFAGDDGVTGVELWRTDGTVVELIEDARPGPLGISPNNLVSTGGLLYFAANDGSLGMEPWVSDGTPAGTYQITDLNPGISPSFPALFVEVDGRILFRADNGTTGRELWAYTPQKVADLDVTKTVDVASAHIGDPAQFTVTVTNNGPDDATGIEVSDPESAGFSFDMITPSHGTYSAGVWSVGHLDVGESASLTIDATLTAGAPLASGTFIDIFAQETSLANTLYFTFGPDGNLYVTDGGSENEVYRFDGATGAFISILVTAGSGGLSQPTGLTFGPDGNLYVASFDNGQILRYDGTTGAFVDVFATDPQLVRPDEIEFGPDGNLYVSAARNPTFGPAVLRFNGTTGAFIDNFTGDDSQIRFPSDFTFGPDGNLYVLGTNTDQVVRYDGTTGSFIDIFVSSIPQAPSGIGGFGLAFGPDGNLYVSTNFEDSILRYDGATGSLIDTFASPDSPSVDQLVSPADLEFGPDGSLYVANGANTPAGVFRFEGFPTNFARVSQSDASDPNVLNNSSSASVVPITNSPPMVSVDTESVEVDEGETAANGGSLGDADGNALLVSTSIGTVVNSGNTTWSWSYATGDGPSQSQTVTITVDDQNGGMEEVEFGLVVNNVAPSVDTIYVPVDPLAIGDQPVLVSADFSDPAAANDNPYTCTIDYGDGSGASAGTVSDFTCTGPDHTYTLPGIYSVHVTVSDKDGGLGEATASAFLVIYDPEGGFVTGGGWIDSPPEACPDFCGGASGKANFGFVSKYKKGQSVPSGETEFNFKAGGLNFHSASYDWLVVAGPQAKFKGNGTINGAGDYGFMLSAVDGKLTGGGDADKFRIKIWTNDASETVVYDNQTGDDEDAKASDEIEGGSIVIHSGNGQNASKGPGSSTGAVPKSFALHQNYPNPFNPTTRIHFDLPEPVAVRLQVIDLLGRVVHTIVDSDMKAGRHVVSFDASGLPSGMYLYHLEAGQFVETRRLVVLK